MMASEITKKDLEEMTATIIEAVDDRFQKIERRMDSFDAKLATLADTLDHFLKRLTDFNDEFTIMKSEVRRLKEVVKDKLGVDINTKP